MTLPVVSMTRAAQFALDLAEHAVVFQGRRFPGAGDDALGLGDSFLRTARGEGVAALAGFVDELLRLDVGLVEHLAVLRFGLGELKLDPLGVGLTLGDALPAFFEHVDDRLEGVGLQHEKHDAESQRLRDERGPVETKNLRDAFAFGEEAQSGKLHDGRRDAE